MLSIVWTARPFNNMPNKRRIVLKITTNLQSRWSLQVQRWVAGKKIFGFEGSWERYRIACLIFQGGKMFFCYEGFQFVCLFVEILSFEVESSGLIWLKWTLGCVFSTWELSMSFSNDEGLWSEVFGYRIWMQKNFQFTEILKCFLLSGDRVGSYRWRKLSINLYSLYSSLKKGVINKLKIF